MIQDKISKELARLIADAQKLQPVGAEDAGTYSEKKDDLVREVNFAMSSRKDLQMLIGGNPVEMMTMNHENHAAFMANVFFLNQFELLAKTVVWVYRTYRAHSFSYDYFPVELRAWMDAVKKLLSAAHQQQILAIYQWMIDVHEDMVLIAEQSSDDADKSISHGDKRKERFLDALLNADHSETLAMALEVNDPAGFASFLLEVIQPSMYEIGRLWEKGTISVAQEHLASSIVGRIMSQLYTMNVSVKPTRGRAVITAAPNEFHELGAWMVSDLLELDGWQIRYLGANTPLEDLLNLLEAYKPQLLALSVTMPFNLNTAKKIITAVREKESLLSMKIMVGGGVFQSMPDIWTELGADAAAENAREAVATARRLCA
jgi:methanogenic corrinoid protein MtbC1